MRLCEAHGEFECGAMSCQPRWKPLPGRVIVTREQQLTSKVIHVIAKDERGMKTADRGKVLAAGDPPSRRLDPYLGGLVNGVFLCEPLKPGDDVFYLGPEERLAIEWEGQRAYAVSYDEVLGVVESDDPCCDCRHEDAYERTDGGTESCDCECHDG